MKVAPYVVPPARSRRVAIERWDGRAHRVPAGSRHGWRLQGRGEAVVTLLPAGGCRSIVRGPRVEIGATAVSVPRRPGRRSTREVGVGGHLLRVAVWHTVEPRARWRARVPKRKAIGALLGFLVSPGVGAGLVVGAMPHARVRFVYQLLVDEVVAGTWMQTTDEGLSTWEHIASAADVEASASDWERRVDVPVTIPLERSAAAGIDDESLVDAIPVGHGDGVGRELRLLPSGPRAFQVSIDLPVEAGGPATARIPHPGGHRRDALLGVGWTVSTQETGTRYFTRSFELATRADAEALIAALREAYAVVYGGSVDFDRWTVTAWQSETASISL